MSPKSRPDRHFFWGYLVALGIASMFSCSASDEPPFGARIESPMKPSSPAPSSVSPSPSLSASSPPVANVHPGPPYPTGTGPYPAPPYHLMPKEYEGVWPFPPSKWWGLKLSPLEQIIADTCPEQVWSQNVPDIDCTEHSECGDGFCDRGHCGAIWTCGWRLGQRCETEKQCGGLCIGGRCQSCMSNEDCVRKLGSPYGVCNRLDKRGPDRFCGYYAPKSRHPNTP